MDIEINSFIIANKHQLSHKIDIMDVLQLEIVADKAGESGDVRDVLALRSSQNWEIGISAKNNHRAVKHSRLSNDIDFGQKW
uniref:HaeIII family restriction endonuclease n=1 Tax=Acinetobacter haemolyticus TaxID=29430 RepID=UPI003007F3A2